MKYCSFLLTLLLLTACKKDLDNPVTDQPPASMSQAFDEFWNELNVNYVYWDIDTTNWDAVYKQYKPIFSGLRIGDTADLAASVGYFRKITDGLTDHHFSIAFTDGILNDSSIFPGEDQWRRDPDFRFSYSYLGSDMHYLDSGYQLGTDYSTGSTLIALSGTIHEDILFFTCNQFLLSAAYQSSASNGVKPVLDYFFARLASPAAFRAVIVDLRDNPGGDANDLNFLVGQFIDQPLRVGYTRNKSGNGRLDYTPWVGVEVSPQAGVGVGTVTIPLYILADRYSQSMAEIITMALRAMPQCKVVGETTFGATGPFAENALYDDGPFTLPGFMSVTTSSVEFKYVDGKIYEGRGFPPDYPVPYNAQALSLGYDPQLEKVLSLIE
jgi:carboxyl-terminal processing protease